MLRNLKSRHWVIGSLAALVLLLLVYVVAVSRRDSKVAEQAVNQPAAAMLDAVPSSQGPGVSAQEAAAGPASGAVMVPVQYQLVRPVVDNRRALAAYYPQARYCGDVGDRAHLAAKPPQDHTPISASKYQNQAAKPGYIYAQDFCQSPAESGFELAHFSRWLYDQLRAGHYPEIKYVISRLPENRAVASKPGGQPDYYGLLRRTGPKSWELLAASGHDTFVHVSYMPGAEQAQSSLIEDYARSQGRSRVK